MPKILVCGKNCVAFSRNLKKALCLQDKSAAREIQVTPSNTANPESIFDAIVTREEIDPLCQCQLKIVVTDGAGFSGSDHILTCGLGRSCDFSFSSIAPGRLQVCLSRELTDCTGKSVEPFEATVRGTLGNAEAILAAQALRVYFMHGSE